MSTSTQPKTFVELYTDLLERVRADSSVTATSDIAKRWVNIGLQDMHIGFGEQFPWAERKDVLRTHGSYTTGTVTVTNGSTTVTGASTAWNTNNAYGEANARTIGKLVFGGTDVYEISAVGSDTSITLDEPYIGDTDSGLSYTYFEDEFDLHADFLRPLDQTYFDQNSEIPLIGRKDFRRRFPRNQNTGKITVGTIVDRAPSGNTAPIRRLRVHRPPSDVSLIPYAFVTNKLALSSGGAVQTSLTADADEPIVPLNYRHAIVLWALYNWYRDRNDDTRAADVKAEYTDIVVRIASDNEIGSGKPQIRPNLVAYSRRAKRPYSSSSRRFITGAAFDEIRE